MIGGEERGGEEEREEARRGEWRKLTKLINYIEKSSRHDEEVRLTLSGRQERVGPKA